MACARGDFKTIGSYLRLKQDLSSWIPLASRIRFKPGDEVLFYREKEPIKWTDRPKLSASNKGKPSSTVLKNHINTPSLNYVRNSMRRIKQLNSLIFTLHIIFSSAANDSQRKTHPHKNGWCTRLVSSRHPDCRVMAQSDPKLMMPRNNNF